MTLITKKDYPLLNSLFEAIKQVDPHANLDPDFSDGPVNRLVLIDVAIDADKLEEALREAFTPYAAG